MVTAAYRLRNFAGDRNPPLPTDHVFAEDEMMGLPDPTQPVDNGTDATTQPDATKPSPMPSGPSSTEESPDRDTPAWEGAEPTESVGLVDPRHEIRIPPGL